MTAKPPSIPVQQPGDLGAVIGYLEKHGPTPFWKLCEELGFDERRLFAAEVNLVRRGVVVEEPGADCAILKLAG